MKIVISGKELKSIQGVNDVIRTELLEKMGVCGFDMFKLVAGGKVTKENKIYTLVMSLSEGIELTINEEFIVDFMGVYGDNLREVAVPAIAMFNSIKMLVEMQPEQNVRFNKMLNKYKGDK